jgi:hypothetical protein
MKNTSNTAGLEPATVTSARRLAAQAEAAMADLEERFSSGMGLVEQTLAERIRLAAARLLECSIQLAADGPMVLGSTGQQRPHPLLKAERELRCEIEQALQKLAFRAENNASFIQAQALTRKRGGARS